ncbi:MAG: hypothetical protein AB7F35_09580 [Acetobacteraceae bacterium]
MIRPITCVCALLALGSGLYLYQSKHAVQLLDRRIEKTVRDTETLREQTRMLHAEWMLLNDPERLRQFSDRYLTLRTVTPQQFTTLTELPNRIPPPRPLEPERPPAATPDDPVPVVDGEPDLPHPAEEEAEPVVAEEVLPVPPMPVPPPSPIVATPAPPPVERRPAPPPVAVAVPAAPVVPPQPERRPAPLPRTVAETPLPRPVPVAESRAPAPRVVESRSADMRPPSPPRPVTPVVARSAPPVQEAAPRRAAPPQPAAPAYGGSLLGMARGSAGGPPAPVPLPRPVPVYPAHLDGG